MFTIGTVAKQYNINTQTLRYYEKNGLLKASVRTKNGYRQYHQNDIERLNFILHAKSVGFTLGEIKDLLTIETEKEHWACQDVKNIVQDRIKILNQQIEQIERFKTSLTTLANNCCGGPESADKCSILSSLSLNNTQTDIEVE